MSIQGRDIIRSRVDAIREAAKSEGNVQQQIKNDLQGFLCSQGLFDEEFKSASLKDASDQRMGQAHMCPWQTCQATRISPDD